MGKSRCSGVFMVQVKLQNPGSVTISPSIRARLLRVTHRVFFGKTAASPSTICSTERHAAARVAVGAPTRQDFDDLEPEFIVFFFFADTSKYHEEGGTAYQIIIE